MIKVQLKEERFAERSARLFYKVDYIQGFIPPLTVRAEVGDESHVSVENFIKIAYDVS